MITGAIETRKDTDFSAMRGLLGKIEKRNKVKITVPPKKRGSADTPEPVLEFYMVKEVPTMALSTLIQGVQSTAVEQDDRGVFWINPTNLAITIHAFIVENFTSLPLPTVEGGDEDELDALFLLDLGDYLARNVPKYSDLYASMANGVMPACKDYVKSLNAATAQIFSQALTAEDILKDDRILNMIKEQVYGDK